MQAIPPSSEYCSRNGFVAAVTAAVAVEWLDYDGTAGALERLPPVC